MYIINKEIQFETPSNNVTLSTTGTSTTQFNNIGEKSHIYIFGEFKKSTTDQRRMLHLIVISNLITATFIMNNTDFHGDTLV